MKMRHPVVLWPGEDGFILASCPFTGASTAGRTREEALAAIREAVALAMEGELAPVLPAECEVVDIAGGA